MLLAGPGTIAGMGSASITFDPADPTRGKECTIETDGLPEGAVINLSWDPPGEPTKVTIGADGKATFTVPDDAETCIATHEESGAEAAAVIQP